MTSVNITERLTLGRNLSAEEVDDNFIGLRDRAHQLKPSTGVTGWSSFGSLVLGAGQMGIETDTGLFKIGNGTSTWSQLLYSNSFMVQSTWAARPVTGLVNGQFGDFSSTFGLKAPLFRWDSGLSLWRPTGVMNLYCQPSSIVGAANTTEQIFVGAQCAIPARLMARTGDTIRVRYGVEKTAAVETMTIRLRLGTAGTTADTALTTSTSFTTGQSHGSLRDIRRESATTVKLLGGTAPAGTVAPSYTGAAGSITVAPITVGNLDTANQILSLSVTMSAGAEVPTIQSFQVDFVPGN